MYDQLLHHHKLPVMEIDGRWKSHPQPAPNCPRCTSTNTKFCYYNNYSLAQPRYFCKDCRRYWTKGGSLRNVPVGGGCRRKSRRRSRSKPEPGPSPLHQPTSSSSSSPQIDLAAVFARYVNQVPETTSSQVEVPTSAEETSFDQGFMEDVLWSTSPDYYSSSSLDMYASSVLDHDHFTTSTVSTDSILGDFNWSCLDDQLTGYQMEVSADHHI